MSRSGRPSSGESESKELSAWQYDLIDQICNAMRAYYCLPEKFIQYENDFKQSLVDTLQKINDDHAPDEVLNAPTSKAEYQHFLNAINESLSAFDPHLELEFNEDFILARNSNGEIKIDMENKSARFDFGSGPPNEVLLEMNEYRGRPEINYGFISAPSENISLPDQIGYLKINFLLDPKMGSRESEDKYRVGPNAVKALDQAMIKLSEKKGIIIDLRDAPEGGSPKMVQYIVSFFIKQKGMIINEIDDRMSHTRTSYKTIDTPSQLFDIPVDILTDETTFSGREELAYDLQQLNIQLQIEGKQIGDRFQVIGEITRGGAHPEFSFPLVESTGKANNHIIIRIPYARSINPTSGTNWEDQETKGVQPDRVVDKKHALTFAIQHLTTVIQQRESKALTTASVSQQSLFHRPRETTETGNQIDDSKIMVIRKKGG